MYLIINCSSCGKIIMANTANRTRTCPHCSSKVNIYSANVLARVKNTQDAIEYIQQLKQQENKDTYKVAFKRFKP